MQLAEKTWWGERRYALLLALITVFVTTLLAFLVHSSLSHANLSLLFLTAVLIVAARTGLEAAFYASVLGFLSYNFFFTRPYYTLFVLDYEDLATLGFFLIMAGISGKLGARMHSEIALNKKIVQRLTNINQFTRLMATAPDTTAVGGNLARHVAETFHATAWVLLQKSDTPIHIYGHDGRAPLEPLSLGELSVLQQSCDDGWYCFELNTGHNNIGMVMLQSSELNPASEDLVRMLCDLATVTLERASLVAELERVRVVSETEQLRSALLSSVSHDLRTPLASIIGSTSSLLEYGESISNDDKRELMHTVLAEAERLNRYIQNLLDMTRLGGGKITLKRDWVDVSDIVSSSAERLRNELKPYNVKINIPDGTPLLFVHGVLIEQALVNVLDNALSFSPPDGNISVDVTHDEKFVMLDVCDEGPGIPVNERENIFDMFYTMREGDRKHQGTGLGLAICRGLIETHGGNVVALDGKEGRGTCVKISLPYEKPLNNETIAYDD